MTTSEIIKLHTSKANSLGGRAGTVDSSDGFLHFKLSSFTEPSDHRTGTNPEELFACGYAGCFGNAVDLNKTESDYYFLTIQLDVGVPGIDQTTAERIVIIAHQICPYSLATQRNVDVKLRVNNQPIQVPVAA